MQMKCPFSTMLNRLQLSLIARNGTRKNKPNSDSGPLSCWWMKVQTNGDKDVLSTNVNICATFGRKNSTTATTFRCHFECHMDNVYHHYLNHSNPILNLWFDATIRDVTTNILQRAQVIYCRKLPTIDNETIYSMSIPINIVQDIFRQRRRVK